MIDGCWMRRDDGHLLCECNINFMQQLGIIYFLQLFHVQKRREGWRWLVAVHLCGPTSGIAQDVHLVRGWEPIHCQIIASLLLS
jgi:hypothetical protein